jgi:hypothetical protein
MQHLFIRILKERHHLPYEACEILSRRLRSRFFPKGTCNINLNHYGMSLAHLDAGVMRIIVKHSGLSTSAGFATTNDIIYVSTSKYQVFETVEDTSLVFINSNDLFKYARIYSQLNSITNFYKCKQIEQSSNAVNILSFPTFLARRQALMAYYPSLASIISEEDILAFLGLNNEAFL